MRRDGKGDGRGKTRDDKATTGNLQCFYQRLDGGRVRYPREESLL